MFSTSTPSRVRPRSVCPSFMPRDVVGEEPLEQIGLGTEPNQLRNGVRCQGELRPDHGMIRKAAVALLQQPPQLRSNVRQVLVCAARRTWGAYTRAIQEQWLVWLNPGESTRKDKGPKGRFRVNRSPLYPVVPGAVRKGRSRLRTGCLETGRHHPGHAEIRTAPTLTRYPPSKRRWGRREVRVEYPLPTGRL